MRRASNSFFFFPIPSYPPSLRAFTLSSRLSLFVYTSAPCTELIRLPKAKLIGITVLFHQIGSPGYCLFIWQNLRTVLSSV